MQVEYLNCSLYEMFSVYRYEKIIEEEIIEKENIITENLGFDTAGLVCF